AYNQRDIAGILAMIRHIGVTVGQSKRASDLADRFEHRLEKISAQAEQMYQQSSRPRVYFEEWNDPMISGIKWVSELIEVAGGKDIFPSFAKEPAATDRVVTSDQVIKAQPDVILASWCGKKVRPEKIAARQGWEAIPAVQSGCITEIKSPLILQPGPAALTDGLDAIIASLNSHREVIS
ncbi:MAG: ABC transporter substrate-binding protein, partial [Pseudomonadota bacterium]